MCNWISGALADLGRRIVDAVVRASVNCAESPRIKAGSFLLMDVPDLPSSSKWVTCVRLGVTCRGKEPVNC